MSDLFVDWMSGDSGGEGWDAVGEFGKETGGGRGGAQDVDGAAGELPHLPCYQAVSEEWGRLLFQEPQAVSIIDRSWR